MTRLGIALLWTLHRFLPLAALTWIGERIGTLLYLFPTQRRRVGIVNLDLCFPDLAKPARNALLKAHFKASGRALMHEAVAYWGTRQELEQLVHVEGLEHFETRQHGPCILMSMHFVGLSIGGLRLSTLHDRCVDIYSTIRNPHLNRLAVQTRGRFGETLLIPRNDGIKPVLRALKDNRPLYYFPDLDYGRKNAVFEPFFGVPAATIDSLPRLAKATHAAVVPLTTVWHGDHYVLRFYPAWSDFPSDDSRTDIRRMLTFFEDRIREAPEQYFWLHKRFKTLPKGRNPIYD